MPAATNVLTRIDRVDRKIPKYRAIYDDLSESVHPNLEGTMGAFGDLDRKKAVLELGQCEGTPSHTIGIIGLVTGLSVFELYYGESSDQLQRFNEYFAASEE